LIPEELESKLMRVGFMPSDDPTIMSPEEWLAQYGINKIELVRIRELHAR
jgi:hypothetical protein